MAKIRSFPRGFDTAQSVAAFLSLKAENTRRRYQGIWNHWISSVASAERATHLQASAYLNKCLQAPSQSGRSRGVSSRCAAATVHNRALVLYSIYEALICDGLDIPNPFQRLRRQLGKSKTGDRRPHELIPQEAVERMLSIVDCTKEGVRDRALMCILFGGALRRSEALGVRVQDVCESENGTMYLHLQHTKAGAFARAVVPPWARDSIVALVEQRVREGAGAEDPLLVTYFSNLPSSGMSASSLYRTFKGICARAGLSGVYTPHCARATAITQLLNQGFSHRDIKEFSRHSSIQMVEAYDKRRTAIDDSIAKKLSFSTK